MRSHDDFGMGQERMICLRRLLLEYVKGSSGDNAAVDGFNKRHFIDNAAAGTVDDAHAFFHHFKLRAGDHMAGFRGERGMDSDEIRATYDIIHRCQLYFKLFRTVSGQERVIGKDVHAKGFGPFGHLAADPAHTEYAERFAAKLYPKECFSVPDAGNGFGIGLRNMAGQCHHHGKSVLTGRDCISVRRVDDNNAVLCGCLQFNIVDAYTGAANHLEVSTRCNNLLRDRCLAAYEQAVIFPDDSDKLIFTESGFFVYSHITCVH
ncbi:hypothetical protein D3C75_872660 [compost metagenome]